MSNHFMDNLKDQDTWIRGLSMLLFALLYSVGEVVLVAVVILQFLLTLITGERNLRLLEFGARLSRYLYQIFLYLTYNSDEKPFPFADWPEADVVHLDEHEDLASQWQAVKPAVKKGGDERVEPTIQGGAEVNSEIQADDEQDAADSPGAEKGPKPTS